MNIIANGSIVCLITHSEEGSAISVFNSGASTLTGVEVAITIPAGLVLDSHTASQGTYTAGVWDVGSLTTAQDADNPETLELCFEITDDSLTTFVITATLTHDNMPDDIDGDNVTTRTISGIPCSAVRTCFGGGLQEFNSMADAIAALGNGQLFIASLANIEGWSYRALLITPNA